jgi:outer membrane protein OmpA-like peptidoglycan-associated protein/flagellar hook assembly protein FlgD
VVKGIESWSLKIMNAGKQAVRTFSGAGTIDVSFAFDGRSDDKTLLPEGTYRAALDVKYVNGNNPRLESPDIVLDLTPPQLKISLDDPVFSPNNDGKKDFATINLATSQEEEWQASIHDTKNKKVVRTYRWKGKPEGRLSWGGQGDDGQLLPDGVYNFLITSTDRAGNTTRSDLQALTINTEETPVLFTAGLTAFSPNGDRVNDAISLIPQLKITSGIDSWTIAIKDQAGKTIRTQSGKKTAPRTMDWDGTTDARTQAPDGTYMAVLQVLYVNGNNPVAKTAAFVIDTKAPAITLSAVYTLFSPDGDGLKDTLPVTQTSSDEELWEAKVADASGRIVRNFFWKGKAANINWDGKDDNGNVLPNGLYAYLITCADQAGNRAQGELKGIEIDVTPTPVFLTLDKPAFSPDNNGILDDVTFDIYAENRRRISGWTIEIAHDKQGVQKTFKGGADLPEKITWDGLADNKSRAPEGTYTGTLTVEYAKGNKPTEKTKPLILDVSPPATDFRLTPLPFSPDNDGVEDELVMTQKVTDATGVARWKIEITDPEKNHFISFQGTGIPAEKIIWNGLSDQGELVQAATDYKLAFTLSDEVGNTASIEKVVPVDVLVIRDGDKLYVRVPSITFKPNTADYKDVSQEALVKNLWTLKRLAQIFSKYRTYNILIEGHAVSVYWRDAARAQREQTEELLPLSKKRAQAVRQALIDAGIEAERISTVGIGAQRPLFAFSDTANLWKNRRVEFILLKK